MPTKLSDFSPFCFLSLSLLLPLASLHFPIAFLHASLHFSDISLPLAEPSIQQRLDQCRDLDYRKARVAPLARFERAAR